MRKSCLLFFVVLLGTVLAIAGIPSVYAQEDGSEEFTLEEVTVTAQKRAESQQKVPIAMEVISGEEITELGKNDIDEILQGVSNTIIEKAQDGYRITIRGVTDNSMPWKAQSMAPPAVALNMDGVFSNKKDSGGGLFDVERVEVLYGPQSTMYSSNSPGGIVNVVTANPKLDKYEGSGSLEYGSYNLVHTEGVMNAPLNDILAVRASFSTTKRDAYVSGSDSDDEDIKSVRLRTLIQPNDNLSFVITGENIRNKSAGFGSGVQTFDTEDGRWYEQTKSGRQAVYVDLGPVTDPWIGASTQKVFNSDQITEKIYTQVNINTAAGNISLTPSYSQRSGNRNMELTLGGGDPEVTYMTQNVEEKSVEIRMSSPEDFPFNWIAGATYYESFDQNIDESQTYLDSSPTTVDGVYYEKWGRWSDRRMTNKNKAIFANVTYPVTDSFRATAGYRQSWDQWISDNYEIKGAPGTPDLSYVYEPFLMENDGNPDYKVGVEYDIGENSMLYANWATSYRVQGMGGPPGADVEDDPERLKAYTVGVKNRFLDNTLQLNAAAYYYDYENYRAGGNGTQVWLYDTDGDLEQDQDETTNDRNANGTGTGRIIGLDLSANWIITPKDRLSMTASYINSEWTELYIDYEYDQTGTVIDGEFVLVDVPDDDFSGESMMSTPPLNINLTYDHNFILPNGASLRPALTVKYKTAFDLSWRKQDAMINHQETYHMEDFNMVYTSADGKMSLSAYCKNITNYAEKRSLLNASGTKLLSIGNPRTYGAVLSVKF